MEPTQIDIADFIKIDKRNYELYSNLSFNRIRKLRLVSLSFSQIQNIISRTKSVSKLSICQIDQDNPTKLDLSNIKVKELYLDSTNFSKTVKLPSFLDALDISCCDCLNNLSVKKVLYLRIEKAEDLTSEEQFWLKAIINLKEVNLKNCLSTYLESLPSSVRRTYADKFTKDCVNGEQIKKRLPRLIQITAEIPIELAETLKLREIYKTTGEYEGKFSMRPRKIAVDCKNARLFNNHPELFEEARKIIIKAEEFNLSVLPRKIKRISVFDVNVESKHLIRLEGEYRQV